MLKTICSLMALLFVLSILYSNKVESRVIQNYDGMPASPFHQFRLGDIRSDEENHNEAEQDGYIHAKRKSDMLLSLYGLPYTLVNRRAAN